MRFRLLPALFVLLALPAVLRAQPTPERYSDVRLLVPADGDLPGRLARHGLVLDHPHAERTARGLAYRVVLSETELAQARAAGVEAEVLVEDLTAHYLATRQGTCEEGRDISRIAANLCGTQGGYPSFSAVVAHLDTLSARYPHLFTTRRSLAQGHEGNDVWMVELSDNPGVDEGEPEALYTAMHHAREPGAMMAVLYFMYYLAEGYGTNPDVTALVDSRRIFFVPVLNPDGYVYNELTDPGGGGYWRKNRRDNGDGSFGVDPNRNYAYNWGYDDEGSSPFTDSETYRGPAPFSEPETAGLRDFLEAGRRVSVAFNYHTSGDLLLYSWTYENGAYTPDNDLFVTLGDTLTAFNGYTAGTSPDVLYKVNGGSDDWMYGEQTTKGKILAFTPEVGYSFWPDPIDVYRLADENLEMNLLLAEAAGLNPVAAEPQAPTGGALALDVTGPNPARDGTTLAFTLPQPAEVRLVLHDARGREVAVLAAGAHAAGRHTARLDAPQLAPGVYVLRLTAGEARVARLLTIAR